MRNTPDSAERRVLDFLDAMEAREIDRANALLGENPRLCFPGGRVFHDLESQIKSSAGRYRRVGKQIERCESWPTANGLAVLVSGTLEGIWTDGRAFSGIRFVDRFELVDGRIVRQEVWNDVAEQLALTPDEEEA